jgi:hypothetical protein
VLVKTFVCPHEVENPLVKAVKHADLHSMKEIRLRKVAYNPGNMSKHVKFSVNMARREVCICCLGVGMTELAKYVVIPPGVLLARRDIISKLVLCSLAPRTDMPLEMM